MGQYLPRELLGEIIAWIPSFVVLTKCILVSKDWKSIIESVSRFELHLSARQWRSYCLSNRSIAGRIVSLSLESPYKGSNPTCRDAKRLDENPFSYMYRLEKLHVTGFKLDDAIIKHILENTPVREFVAHFCKASLGHLTPLAHIDRDVSLSVMLPHCMNDEPLRGVSPELLSVMSRLKGLDYSYVHEMDYKDDAIIQLYETLSKSPNLESITIQFNDIYGKYIPLMKNLTSISILQSDMTSQDLPDLSGMARLKKLSLTCTSVGCREYASKKLGSLLDQLTHFGMNHYRLCDEDISRLPSLHNLTELSLVRQSIPSSQALPPRLTSLNLMNSVISEDTLIAIRSMDKLAFLNVYETQYRNKKLSDHHGADVIVLVALEDLCCEQDGKATCMLQELVGLDVYSNDRSIRVLESFSCFPKLRRIALYHTMLYNEGMFLVQGDRQGRIHKLIKSISEMTTILEVRLKDYILSTEDASALASMPALERLSIDSCSMLTDWGSVCDIVNDNNLYSMGFESETVDLEVTRSFFI